MSVIQRLSMTGSVEAENSGWSANQFRIFRFLLGAYIAIHFAHLLPWSSELFSSTGMLGQATLSPLLALFPNLLAINDHPLLVQALVCTGVGAGLGLALGHGDRYCAAWAWFLLATLFTRNPLIANPAMPYVGWMLVAYCFVPRLPALSDVAGNIRWRLSPVIFTAAWVVLALSYSYSGYTKLLSPSWVSGDNVAIVLENPLARDWLLRDAVIALPAAVLKTLTWFILLVELLFAPLALIKSLRPVLWTLMFCVQLGFLLLLNFADLTLGMLLFHMLTFDPGWIREPNSTPIRRIYYDGDCGICNRLIAFALSEDRREILHFQPLQGSPFECRGLKHDQRNDDTFLVELRDGTLLERGAAVVRVCRSLGGLWALLGLALSVLPERIVDFGYGQFAAVRLCIAPLSDRGDCPLVPVEIHTRLHQANADESGTTSRPSQRSRS